jgi:lysophospholipase L1-like esterase
MTVANPFAAIQSALLTCGITPVDIICMGDSITESMVCAHREQGYVQRLRDLLRAARFSGSVSGGLGYAPSYSVSASVGDFWQRSEPVDLGTLGTGLGIRMLKVWPGGSASFGFTGTGLDVLLTTGQNSALTYQVDGGAVVSLDQRVTDGLHSGVVLPVRGLCNGPHSITICGCTLGNAYVEGAMVYRGDETAGVRMWEAGHSGAKASDLNVNGNWWGSFKAVPAPKLVTIMYGTNEYQQAVPVATFAADLQTLVTTVRALLNGGSCSVLLMSAHKRMPIAGCPDWSLYEAAVANCATANGCGYLAMSPVIGDPAAAIAAGLIESGVGTHPTAAGHLVYSKAIANAVLGAAP